MPAPRHHLGALSPDGLNAGQPWTAGTSLLWSLRPRQGSEGKEPSRRRKQQPVIPRAGSRGMAWAGSEEGDAAVQGLPYNSPEKRPLALAVPHGLSTATHHVRAAHRPRHRGDSVGLPVALSPGAAARDRKTPGAAPLTGSRSFRHRGGAGGAVPGLTSPSPSSCPSAGRSAGPASCPASSAAGPSWQGPGTCPWSHCRRRGPLPG